MIYLDHNATSPLLPEVLEAMTPWLGVPGNPASVHRSGQRAAAAVDRAREEVAGLLGRDPAGIVFTSGATEANQTWWAGIVELGVRTLATSAIEHPCVRGAAERARRLGAVVHELPVGPDGVVRVDALPEVEAVSLMAANHETGVLQPVAQVLERPGLRVHVDATQAAGRVPLDLAGAHGVVLSGHKLGGPSGTGVLSLPDGGAYPPLLVGGAQERGRRAGTVNVAGVVGLGAACVVAQRDLAERTARWTALRSHLEAGLAGLGARVVGSGAPRVPQTTCVVLPVGPSELVVQGLDLQGIAVSAGAACASGSQEPSPVLLAMGEAHPNHGLRVSLGPNTGQADVDALLSALGELLPRLDALS